jgi:amino acid transporter
MGVFTLLKVLPLLLLILLGLQHVTGATLVPAGFHIDNIGGTTLLLIYAYVGFETVGVTAGETSRPQRTIPIALVRTLLLTGLLYFFIVLVYISVIPAANYANATLVDVGRSLAGPAGALVITFTAVFSIGGNLASSILAAPRLLFSLAEQRLLPQWFGNVHKKYATPDRAIIAMGAMALVLGLSSNFVDLAIGSSVVRLLGYIICIASLPVIRRNAKAEKSEQAWRLRGGYAIPAAALLICLWLIGQSEGDDWIKVSILLLIGLGLYLVEKWYYARK